MKRFAILVLVTLFASSAHAQTSASATWTQTEAPAVAGAMQDTLQIDAVAPVVLTPTCVAATAPATGSNCSAPFALSTPTAAHTYVLVVCSGGFCAATSTGGQAPGLGGFKIKVTVTVVSGSDDEDDQG